MPALPRLPRQGLILLAALSLLWGANWPIMKVVLAEVPPLYFRSICLLCGGVGMLALAKLSGLSLRVPRGQWRRVLWLALFNVSGWNAAVAFGVLLLPSGRAALLGYTMPLWSTLLAIACLGDRLTARTTLAVVLGLSGVGVLVAGSVDGLLHAPEGGFCMLLGAWSWAIGVVLFKRMPVDMPTSSLTGWMLLTGALPLLGMAIPLETTRLAVPSFWPVFGMVYNALAAFMFCYWAWNRIVQMVPVSVSSVSSLSTPLIGVIGGTVFLGEPLGWREALASLLILGAVGAVSLGRR